MGYLFAAYAVFWGFTFIYVFSMANRQKNLAREIEALKRAIESKTEGK